MSQEVIVISSSDDESDIEQNDRYTPTSSITVKGDQALINKTTKEPIKRNNENISDTDVKCKRSKASDNSVDYAKQVKASDEERPILKILNVAEINELQSMNPKKIILGNGLPKSIKEELDDVDLSNELKSSKICDFPVDNKDKGNELPKSTKEALGVVDPSKEFTSGEKNDIVADNKDKGNGLLKLTKEELNDGHQSKELKSSKICDVLVDNKDERKKLEKLTKEELDDVDHSKELKSSKICDVLVDNKNETEDTILKMNSTPNPRSDEIKKSENYEISSEGVIQKLAQVCLKFDSGSDMQRILKKKLLEKCQLVNSEYLKSIEFKDFVNLQIKKIIDNPSNLFVPLKEVIDELKARKTSGVTCDGQGDVGIDHSKAKFLRKLKKMQELLHRKIKKLETKEVNFDDDDDSTYIQLQRYKDRIIKVTDKIFELEGTNNCAEKFSRPRITFSGTPFPSVNRAIEKFVFKTGVFPDYYDVLNLLKDSYEKEGVSLPQEGLKSTARTVFEAIGEQLQKKRQLDYWDCHCALLEDSKDPAECDELLQKQLNYNKEKYGNKINEVINHYANLKPKEDTDSSETKENSSKNSDKDKCSLTSNHVSEFEEEHGIEKEEKDEENSNSTDKEENDEENSDKEDEEDIEYGNEKFIEKILVEENNIEDIISCDESDDNITDKHNHELSDEDNCSSDVQSSKQNEDG